MERLIVFDLQPLQRPELALNHRMLSRMSEGTKGEDGVEDRRENRAQAGALVEMLYDPLRCFLQRAATKWFDGQRFDEFQHHIEGVEERAPEALTAGSLHHRGGTTGRDQLADRPLVRDVAGRLKCPDHRQRNDDAA